MPQDDYEKLTADKRLLFCRFVVPVFCYWLVSTALCCSLSLIKEVETNQHSFTLMQAVEETKQKINSNTVFT